MIHTFKKPIIAMLTMMMIASIPTASLAADTASNPIDPPAQVIEEDAGAENSLDNYLRGGHGGGHGGHHGGGHNGGYGCGGGYCANNGNHGAWCNDPDWNGNGNNRPGYHCGGDYCPNDGNHGPWCNDPDWNGNNNSGYHCGGDYCPNDGNHGAWCNDPDWKGGHHGNGHHFTDVAPDHWYNSAVSYVYSSDLFAGISETLFGPNVPMTRGMVVTVLGKQAEIDAGQYTDRKFSDVRTGDYFAPYVQWAYENGIVSGIGNNQFGPNQLVSRQDMIVMLYKYAGFIGADNSYEGDQFNAFMDRSSVAPYADVPMQWAVSHGIVSGVKTPEGNKIDPANSSSRAQFAQVLFQSKDLLAKD